MEQPEVDRSALYEEMRRGQSDWEDWNPRDCDFWSPAVCHEEEEE